MSTGMPRPSSATVIALSWWIVTAIFVQTPGGDRADVHRRTPPDRFQTLEDLDGVGLIAAVAFFFVRSGGFLLWHQFPNVKGANVLS